MNTLKAFNKEMCRVCLRINTELADIFTFSSKLGVQIANAISMCAPVQISKHDGLPNFICSLCYNKLKTAHEFQSQVVRSEKTFNLFFKKSDNQTDTSSLCNEEQSSSNFLNNVDEFEAKIKLEIEHQDNESDIHFDFLGNDSSEPEANLPEIKKEEIPQVKPLKRNKRSKFDNIKNKEVKSSKRRRRSKLINNCNNSFDSSPEFEIKGKRRSKNRKSSKYVNDKNGNSDENLKLTSNLDVDSFDDADEIEEKVKSLKTETDIKENVKSFLRKIIKKKRKLKIAHECTVCGKRFSHLGNLSLHKRIHSGERPFLCEVCGSSFTQLGNLAAHQRIHSNEKPYICEMCDKCFAQASHLIAHKKIHTGEKNFQCDICDKRFSELSYMKRHRRVHTGEKPFRCDVCQKFFTRMDRLKVHKRLHSGEKPYKCDSCDKCFTRCDKLKEHKRTHSGEKPYQCNVCGKIFAFNAQLKTHNITHLNEDSLGRL